MRAAPSAVVAVPITRAPSAASLCRDGGADSARSTGYQGHLSVQSGRLVHDSFSSCGVLSARRGQCGVERFRILEREHFQIAILVDAPVERGEHLARTAFDDVVAPAPIMVRTVDGPVHRGMQLFDQRRRESRRVRV